MLGNTEMGFVSRAKEWRGGVCRPMIHANNKKHWIMNAVLVCASTLEV